MAVSTKVAARIASQLKVYQGILAQAVKKDSNEADTSAIVASMISDVLGYNKFEHVSSQHAIRGTYVDLMVSTDNKPRFLVEVKAVGAELKDSYIKQAVDYAANKGVDWVVLTNAVVWRLYRVIFTKPIDRVLVCDLNVLETNYKAPEVIECFGNLSLEQFSKDTLSDWFNEKRITSKFAIAALILSDSILDAMRLEIRRLSRIRVDVDDLKSLLTNEVIKRDLIDGDEAKAACAFLKRLQKRLNAKHSEAGDDDPADQEEAGQETNETAPPTPASAPTLAAEKPQA
jgi:Type I restriction enzyme R protein N terminus (HSDR_N)